MKNKDTDRQQLYGTKQVAAALGIPEWRVKNFAEGKAYKLKPSVVVGSGRGSRRLYSEGDLRGISLAQLLSGHGMTVEEIGAAVKAAIPWMTKDQMEKGLTELERKGFICLTRRESRKPSQWELTSSDEISGTLTQGLKVPGSKTDVYILDLSGISADVAARLESLKKKKVNTRRPKTKKKEGR